MFNNIKKHRFFIRLLNWEYWPSFIIYIPVFFLFLYYALRSRTLFFFARANPAIETGGMMGESKSRILSQVPEKWKPQTLFISHESSFDEVKDNFKASGLTFPIIAKPDVGERGFLVAKIENEEAFEVYCKKIRADFLVQEYIDLPLELSVLHYRFPSKKQGEITSICIKELLTVTGDGRSTIRELMEAYPRAKLQLQRLLPELGKTASRVPEAGEEVTLEPIGNHVRGTLFRDANHRINSEITEAFDRINHSLEGIYFCRYDLRCRDWETLAKCEEVKILEINGVAGEPAHIYDPDNSIWNAYRDLFRHWNIIYRISREQQKNGVAAMQHAALSKVTRRCALCADVD